MEEQIKQAHEGNREEQVVEKKPEVKQEQNQQVKQEEKMDNEQAEKEKNPKGNKEDNEPSQKKDGVNPQNKKNFVKKDGDKNSPKNKVPKKPFDKNQIKKDVPVKEAEKLERVGEPKEQKLYKVLGVMFEITKKRYYFEVTDGTVYKRGEKVLVDTARGKEIGVVYGEARELPEKELVLPLKPVIKKANQEEVQRYSNLKEEAEAAFFVCKQKVMRHELPMKIVGAEFTFDKSKLIFYFTAEGRIDFRELVKDLATVFKLRIELRQIGVRDEARILGSIGICGKELCCRTFINKFDSVSIKMARDQGLVINPSKISGACGRLLCCIKYEHSQYSEALKGYPAVHQIVDTEMGTGKVMSVNPLNGYLYVDVYNKGILKLTLEDLKFSVKEAKKLQNKLTAEEKKLRTLEKE